MQVNRRNFLRTAGAASLLALPASHILAKVFTSDQMFNPGESFSLKKLEALARNYIYPDCAAFDTRNWQHRFKHYNFYPGEAFDVGELILQKTTTATGANFTFLDRTKIFDRKIQRYFETQGTMDTKSDTLSTPKTWQWSTNTVQPEEIRANFGTLRTLNGHYKRCRVELKDGETIVAKSAVHKALSWKYGVVDVAQQMAQHGVLTTNFDLLDGFDTTLKGCQLRFNRNQEVMTGLGGSVIFKVYDLVGHGIIPTVYWVDGFNRVLFIISGMEAHILQQAK